MVFVRPCRSATIRTRLDGKTVHERLSALAGTAGPEGFGRLMAHGYFTGGSVGPRDFELTYHFNSHRNPQTYSVYGKVQETPDWRVLRLRLTAYSPWLSRWSLVGLVLYLGFLVYTREVPPGGAVLLFGFVIAVLAFANLFYIPDVVTSRVSSILASEVRGTVLQRGEWVVPR